MKKRRTKYYVGLICLFSLLLFGCNKGADENTISEDVHMASRDIFAMDTYMSLTGYGENSEDALDAAVEEIQRLDALFSVGYEDSEIAKLNKEGKAIISTDTETILKEALKLYDTTDGVFDISIYPLMELWGFTTDSQAVPSEEEIEEILPYVDASQIQYDEEAHTIMIGQGQGIDLGGIAKGYTSDRIMQIFKEYDLVSGLVSLGGNVQCYGRKVDGSDWKCGIQDPDDENAVICVASVNDKAVITSGGYERYFVDESGKTWHHILNPKTGYSAESGLDSVTIISREGILADGLSTSLFVMGLDRSAEYWKEHQDEFDMILITTDREIYISEGLEGRVTSNYPLNVVYAQ